MPGSQLLSTVSCYAIAADSVVLQSGFTTGLALAGDSAVRNWFAVWFAVGSGLVLCGSFLFVLQRVRSRRHGAGSRLVRCCFAVASRLVRVAGPRLGHISLN